MRLRIIETAGCCFIAVLYQLSTSYGCSLCQPHGLQSSCFEVNTQIIKIIQKNLRFCSISITLNKKTNDENRITEQEIILIPQVAPPLPALLHRSRSSIVFGIDGSVGNG